MNIEPTDLTTLAELAEELGLSLATTRKWTFRYSAFPAPWRVGRTGEPHLYLSSEIWEWLRETGRLK